MHRENILGILNIKLCACVCMFIRVLQRNRMEKLMKKNNNNEINRSNMNYAS